MNTTLYDKHLDKEKYEQIYPKLIEFIMSFNDKYHKEKMFVYIRGGASIKHFLNQHNIDTIGLTNDIDIFLVPVNDSDCNQNNFHVLELLEFLVEELKKEFADNSWKLRKGDPHKIYINDYSIFDVRIYGETTKYELDIDNMMRIFHLIYTKKYVDNLKSSTDINKITFTSIQYEYLVVRNCIIYYESWINSIEKCKSKWQDKLINYTRIVETLTDEKQIKIVNDLIEQYKYKMSDEYINKLIDKCARYHKKIQLIEPFLKQQT